MTTSVVTASPDTSVLVARRLLAANGIRHLPVVVGEEVVGIVSDRDIRINDRELVATLGALQSDLINGRYRRLASVMTAPARVIHPKMKVHIAALFMVSRQIGALPVVEDGKLVGIISLTDCVRALAVEDRRGQNAGDVGRLTPMPSGDPRPGRPQHRAVAVVVDPNPAARLRARNDLAAAGFAVMTCPGSSGGTYCPALRVSDAENRCARVPEDAELVLLNTGDDDGKLAEAYGRWLPDATIRFTRSGPAHHP